METIEHFARISLVARLLGGERLLSREEVARLQDLRGRYGIASPAPICPDPEPGPAAVDPTCQVLVAPSAPGERLVPEAQAATGAPAVGPDGEIRLTYAQLTTLVDEVVRETVDGLRRKA
jgi:L-fuculose-phosphate aldolase